MFVDLFFRMVFKNFKFFWDIVVYFFFFLFCYVFFFFVFLFFFYFVLYVYVLCFFFFFFFLFFFFFIFSSFMDRSPLKWFQSFANFSDKVFFFFFSHVYGPIFSKVVSKCCKFLGD